MLVNKVTTQSIEVKLTATMASKKAGYKDGSVSEVANQSW